MSVQFVLGPAASGKTTMIQQEIARLNEENPQQKILYIVPEQMTLNAQRELLEHHRQHGILNTEVLSFNRLAHRVFEETGMLNRKLLDDMGKSMVLYKIVADHKDELQYYQACVGQKGFIGQLKIMITELYQYHISDEELERMIEKQDPGSILYYKWMDIRKIWKYFQDFTAQEMISSEQVLDVLAERIRASKLIAGSRIYLDDFSGFTPQQYRVLKGLMHSAERVTFCLSMDRRAWEESKQCERWQELSMSLFRETQKTYLKLQAIAKEGRIPYRSWWCDQIYRPEALSKFAGEIFRNNAAKTEIESPVWMERAAGPSKELKNLLHEILHLVRNEGYRFRDIAVVAPNMERYGHSLRRMLQVYGIPYYMDQKTDVTLNPMAQLLIQSLKMVWGGCVYDTMFSFLKTGLTPLAAEEIDQLENEALKENWRGHSRYIHELRQKEEWAGAAILADALETFFRESGGTQKTVAMRLQAVKGLLENLQIETRMEEISQRFKKEQELLKAMEYHRMPELIRKIQEHTEAVLGRVEMEAREFAALMNLGLEQCRMAMLPPSLDQLIVGDIQKVRLSHVKVLFVIGFENESFPATDLASGLLTGREREISGEYMEMAPARRENLLLQYFQLYSLLGKAEERIYISCSRSGMDGAIKTPAVLWGRMEELSGEKSWPDRGQEPTLPQVHLLEAGADLSGQYREWYQKNGYRQVVSQLKAANREKVPEEKLERQTVEKLLDLENRFCSVSQIEQYARCPFSYFMRYGLALKEREEPKVRHLDDGNVLHEILEEAGRWFEGLWGTEDTHSEEELMQYVADLYQNKKEEYSVYQTTARYRYYWRKLQETAGYALQMLNRQVQAGEFVPAAFEWNFGRFGGRPVEIPLKDGRIRLQGKIDRIDILQETDGDYLRIIDYKSGRSGYSESDMYAGVQLQLPIYMEAALENSDRLWGNPGKPAGFFYFHLVPQLQSSAEEVSEAKKKEILIKEARLEGLLLEDRVVAEKMDRNWEDTPQVIRARLNKDGKFDQRSKTATKEQFADLGWFCRGKVAELAEQIRSGKASASPVRWPRQQDRKACDFCEYKGACRFDEKLPGAQMRDVEKIESEEFWKKISEGSEKK